MTGLLYILGGFLFLIIIATIVNSLRIRRLRREREGNGISSTQFVEAFSEHNVSPEIPTAVYDYYGSLGTWKGFKFLPDDKYSRVLYDDPEDIHRDAKILLERLGLHVPPTYILAKCEKQIETLRDMVLWLDCVRQHQSQS
jgi:hypothetical protein